MKVKELIKKLQKYDPEMLVVECDYLANFSEIKEIKEIYIAINPVVSQRAKRKIYYRCPDNQKDREDVDIKAITIN